MITALAISVVAILGFAGGYRTGHSIGRALGVLIGGLAFIVAVFIVAVVLPNPDGEGWVNRVLLLGHWVPNWEWNLEWWAFIAWFFAVWAGWLHRGTVQEKALRRAN